MGIPVYFLNCNPDAPEKGYWDMHLLEEIFNNSKPAFEMVCEGAYPRIVVIPGRQNVNYIKQINQQINELSPDGVLLIITGDEDGTFPTDELEHPNMKVWLMLPHPGKRYPKVDRFIGSGTTPHMKTLQAEYPKKDVKWFFAGQVTHKRRRDCVAELEKMSDGVLLKSPGFTQGMKPEEYVSWLSSSRVVPCPSGAIVPDSFRLYEALEAGCVPIADAISSVNETEGYWQLIFGEQIPFPIIKNWSDLPGLVEYYNDIFTRKSNEIFAWWQLYKRNLMIDLIKDFHMISGYTKCNNGITAVVPTSPVLSNPDTSIIEETINSIRTHLPYAEIFITFDGIRPEQEELRDKYEEFKSRILWKCNREWKNVVPLVFEEHMHQVAMLRETLRHIHTDKILYVEHDTPLTPDVEINWESVISLIDSNKADLVRFHFEAFIPKEHEYLMLDKEAQEHFSQKFVRTVQWSQRPHLASKKFYERILADHFSPEARTFIEDKMHGVVVSAWDREQVQGWNKFRLWIYHPDGGNIKRSYHLDGRGSEQKYDMKF